MPDNEIDICTDLDLKLNIVSNMEKFGGSFVKALARCIVLADRDNLGIIEQNWQHYLREYHPDKWPKRSNK